MRPPRSLANQDSPARPSRLESHTLVRGLGVFVDSLVNLVACHVGFVKVSLLLTEHFSLDNLSGLAVKLGWGGEAKD